LSVEGVRDIIFVYRGGRGGLSVAESIFRRGDGPGSPGKAGDVSGGARHVSGRGGRSTLWRLTRGEQRRWSAWRIGGVHAGNGESEALIGANRSGVVGLHIEHHG